MSSTHTDAPDADCLSAARQARFREDPIGAVAQLEARLAQAPDALECRQLLALAYARSGRREDAERTFREVLRAAPEHAIAAFNFGQWLADQGRWDEAVTQFERVCALSPGELDPLLAMAGALHASHRLEEFDTLARRAVHAFPGDPRAWRTLGDAMIARGRHEDALVAYAGMLLHGPETADARNCIGLAHQYMGKLDAAMVAFQRAARLAPEHPAPVVNLYSVLLSAGRTEAAARLLQALLQHHPRDPDVVLAGALARLTHTPDAIAWQAFEARRAARKWTGTLPPALAPEREWRGQPLAGKRLLVRSEQGFGDSLFFARFLPDLRAMGACVVVNEHPAVLPLLDASGLVDEGSERRSPSDPLAAHDHWLFMASLPLRLGLQGPRGVDAGGYLRAEPADVEAWARELAPGGKAAREQPRIGLVWAGGRAHLRDRVRSLAATTLAPLVAALPGARFLALQVDGGSGAEQLGIEDFGSRLDDFATTAALLANVDLLITVDTAIANLAGAMARPVWVLLDVGADWRWGGDGEVSAWYPTARLFRQAYPGDWAGVVREVTTALVDWRREWGEATAGG